MIRGAVRYTHFAPPVLAKLHVLNRPVMQDIAESPRSKFWDVLLRWLIPLAILACILTRPTAAAEATAKNVLILFRFFHPGEPFTSAVESSVRADFPGSVSFTLAYLENARFEEESYQQSLADSFHEGYGREKPDVVIAVDYSTLEFLVKYRDKIFPGLAVPIVIVGVASNWLDGRPT